VSAAKLNGAKAPSVIARTKEYLIFKEGECGLALLDVDLKGIPDDAKRRMEECGGPWGALCEVLPALKTVARVERASTSSGLRNRETGDNHGLLLKWIDLDGEQHKCPMPIEWVHADGNAIAAELHSAGLRCNTSRPAHELLKRFFGDVIVRRRVRCVDQTGWHGTLYVLPNGRVFGVDAESIVLQTERAAAGSAYVERGTLPEWRDNVARCAVGNDLLALSISAGFAAPLLDVLGEPSGGVHLHGTSQTGKTTLLRSAMSVYSPADDKHMRTWRATANGLEAVASETSDGLLILDELSQANAREVDQVVYMLANSASKARANRAGGARAQRNWR